MKRTTLVDGKFSAAGAGRDYARAFRDYGVNVEELAVDASIERLKARPVLVLPIAVALDEWVGIRRMVANGDVAGWKRLVAIAHGIDPEPLRDRLRSITWPLTPEARDELRLLPESIDVRAHHPATLYRLAVTLKQAELRESALRILRKAYYVHPGDYYLNEALGYALRGQKDYEGAIRFETVAISLRPHVTEPYFVLSQTLRRYGRRDEAEVAWRKGAELDGSSEPKKPDEAIATYRKAIEADPKNAYAYSGLATALRARGKPAEAIAVYRQAMDAIPEDAGKHWREIGDILRDQKKPVEAADAYHKAIAAHRQAIEARPEEAFRLLLAIGDILRDQGKPDEANAIYRQAIEAVPKNAGAYHALGDGDRKSVV